MLTKGSDVFHHQPEDIYKIQTDIVKPVRPCYNVPRAACFKPEVFKDPSLCVLIGVFFCFVSTRARMLAGSSAAAFGMGQFSTSPMQKVQWDENGRRESAACHQMRFSFKLL